MANKIRSLLQGTLLMGALSGLAAVNAHHSTAMFDSENPIELVGKVVDWQFENPHVFIILEVNEEDGKTVVWELEGPNVNGLTRSGWTPKTLLPGDEIMLTVHPLRSGAAGGSYRNVRWAANGAPIDPKAGRPE